MGKQNGTKNLITMAQRTPEEQREISRKGGLASAAAKKRRKEEAEEAGKVAEILRQLLELPLKNKVSKNGIKQPLEELEGAESLQAIGSKNVRTKVALGLALIKEGLEGNIKATEMVLRMIGEDVSNKKEINITGGLPVIIAGEDDLED